MAKLVYALFDAEEMKLSQFSADATILAKDAVSAYLVEKVIPTLAMPEEEVKDFLTLLSNSKDVPELISIMEHYGFHLALMPI